MLRKAIAVLLGSLLCAVGINAFFVPYHLIDGGMIGVGLLAHYVWGLPAGLVMVFASIPLYIWAWFSYRPYFYNSLHGLLISSFLIDVLAPLRNWLDVSVIISAISGGLLVGIGIGVMLSQETSTGGTDLAAQLTGRLIPWNIGIIIFFIDGLVLLAGANVIGWEAFFQSLLAVCTVGIATSTLVARTTPSM